MTGDGRQDEMNGRTQFQAFKKRDFLELNHFLGHLLFIEISLASLNERICKQVLKKNNRREQHGFPVVKPWQCCT